LAIDLASSISPCMPNMRFTPFSGFILLPLKAKAPARKPSEPIAAGVATAATRVRAKSRSTGMATAPSRRRIARPGSKSATAETSKLSPSVTMDWSEVIIIGPARAIQAAPISTTKAVPSSRD
jgi:hypothetical protein